MMVFILDCFPRWLRSTGDFYLQSQVKTKQSKDGFRYEDGKLPSVFVADLA